MTFVVVVFLSGLTLICVMGSIVCRDVRWGNDYELFGLGFLVRDACLLDLIVFRGVICFTFLGGGC